MEKFFADIASSGHDRIIEIVMFLLKEIRGKNITEIDLSPLNDRGFTQTEISTAFSWLFDKLTMRSSEVMPMVSNAVQSLKTMQEGPIEVSTFRIFHDVERSVLSMESQGYLLQMRELGLLSDAELEMLIDRILVSGTQQVNLQEIKELAGNLIFDFDDSSRIGSRMMLSAKDTIH